MYVTYHAAERIAARIESEIEADNLILRLEDIVGEPGTVAYAALLDAPIVTDDGSNGDTLVVIAVEGSVETVYFRRATQDMSASFFGARKVVRL
jgi:hypothetical protein